jgi:hypothetical protein
LKGIREEVIRKHKSGGAFYCRCGQSNHYTIECNAKMVKIGDSLEKPTISSQNKKKINDDDEESKATNKIITGAFRPVREEQQQK